MWIKLFLSSSSSIDWDLSIDECYLWKGVSLLSSDLSGSVLEVTECSNFGDVDDTFFLQDFEFEDLD